jgi:hypothetical protein
LVGTFWYRTFGRNPFFPRFCPLFDGPSPPFEGSSRKISQNGAPSKSYSTQNTVHTIPYQIYQPASAGNLPIPAKLPVNRWDATLDEMDDYYCNKISLCPKYIEWTRLSDKLEMIYCKKKIVSQSMKVNC